MCPHPTNDPRRYVSTAATAGTALYTAPVVARKFFHDGAVLVSVHIALDTSTAPKTLRRPAQEPLSKTFGRLSATLDKHVRKGMSSKHQHRSASFANKSSRISLLDTNREEINLNTPLLEAVSNAAQLRIGDTHFDVLFDPPEITSLLLPAAPLVGIPLRPFAGTINCSLADCRWSWERRAVVSDVDPQAQWECVGRGGQFVPTHADVGAAIRVRVEPIPTDRQEAHATMTFLGKAIEIPALVEQPPVRKLLAPRLSVLPQRILPDQFRIMSYNLMANAYARNWNEPGAVHSYCSPSVTCASHRMPRLLAEVLAYDADIICLQEVDRLWYEQMWIPHLEAAGYVGHFAVKSNAGSSEGLATFVRQSAFEVVEAAAVPLNLQDGPIPPNLQGLLDTQPLTEQGLRDLPSVAQFLMLREVHSDEKAKTMPKRHLLVANTHLYYANPAVHVRLMQMAAIVHHATERIQARHESSACISTPAFVLAGDFNSDSTDAAVRFLSAGNVSAADPDWLNGMLFWPASLGLNDDVQRTAAASAIRAIELNASLHAGGIVAKVSPIATSAAHVLSPANQTREHGSDSIQDLRKLQAFALRYHRLRKALIVVLNATDPRPPRGGQSETVKDLLTQVDVSVSRGMPPLEVIAPEVAAAGQVLQNALNDADAGRTLLDSKPLAAAEISHEMRLPLIAASKPNIVEAACARLAELALELQSGSDRLRARAMQVQEKQQLPQLGPQTVEGQKHFVAFGGVPLSHPIQLQSAYGLHTQPTHVVPGYKNALDWIFFDVARLRVEAVAPIPSFDELKEDFGMPSAEWPSDHVSLVCDLAWKNSAVKLDDERVCD